MSELNRLIQTESVAVIEETLNFLLYECSIDDAPTAEEIAIWRDMLAARGRKFLRLSKICQTWLDEEAA
ncbi:TPA: dioxygenase [Neisseria meningitidis]|uniref:dioxygenase n=1 Tax=Neisseria sp. Marseille-Q6792 TaxID=2937985 RepID=UPI002024870F|nr:dioxygenase [Neisseria sp. Marseille-Q6792]